MIYFLSVLFMIIAVLLVLVILVQRGRGGGLSGAFGSGGGSSSAFGTKTGDVFTTATVILFVVFMVLAVWLNFKFQAPEDITGIKKVAATAPANSISTSAAMPEEAPIKPGLTTQPTAVPAPATLPK